MKDISYVDRFFSKLSFNYKRAQSTFLDEI
jgi:hypothetical protein